MPITQTFQVDSRILNPSVGVGITIPFTQNSAFKPTYSYKEQIKYNLINLLLTNKQERVFNPNFGTNLRNQIFNQLVDDNFETTTEDIRNLIQVYFPEIIINNIKISSSPNTNTLIFILDYSIKLTQESDNISINFE